MGFEGFDSPDANAIFEEAARASRGGMLDYNVLVWKAKQDGEKGLDALKAWVQRVFRHPFGMKMASWSARSGCTIQHWF